MSKIFRNFAENFKAKTKNNIMEESLGDMLKKRTVVEDYNELKKLKTISRKFRRFENHIAKMIAIVIRNQMEDFHCKHLTDAQMKELNPIIRNSIYTALIQMQENPNAMDLYYRMYVPPYWEDCELVW